MRISVSLFFFKWGLVVHLFPLFIATFTACRHAALLWCGMICDNKLCPCMQWGVWGNNKYIFV